jgi:UDP-glucose 4,6-dehydratase
MVMLMGSTGYIGRQFLYELEKQGKEIYTLSRTDVDYYKFDLLKNILDTYKPDFLINCAGYTGKPNVDACELHKDEADRANVNLPRIIAKACEITNTPWGHVSSGCIYTGDNGGKGFTEEDAPNFSFDHGNCSYYSGTKVLGEEAIKEVGGDYYIWRLRIPFDQYDSPRNYLSKIINYDTLLNADNSISHRADFAKYCISLWSKKCDYGIYNVTNTDAITTEQVTKEINKILKLNKNFEFFRDEEQMYEFAAKTPRSNCTLDNSKLRNTGIRVRKALTAIRSALKSWEPEETNADSSIDKSFWK